MEIRQALSRLTAPYPLTPPFLRLFKYTFAILFLCCSSVFVVGEEAQTPPLDAAEQKLIKRTEALKQKLVDLNRELYEFEESLLYPTNTQLAVFLSIEPKSTFLLDSIELRLDNKIISSYLYKEKELAALKQGGVQRLFLGSLSDGKHKLTASFNGQGSNSRYFRRKKAMNFNKEQSAKYIQLIVTENERTREPLFKVKQW